jgi:Mn-dependent DtxR family transcriptional regulator
MERAILRLLEEDGALTYERIAAVLDEPPDAVRSALQELRDRGWVELTGTGEIEGHSASPSMNWQLTPDGSEELARSRLD